jgi:hypothetical protein
LGGLLDRAASVWWCVVPWGHHSTKTSSEAGVQRWDSGQGGYCVNRGKLVSGDIDQDGRDDIVSMYDHGGSDTAEPQFHGHVVRRPGAGLGAGDRRPADHFRELSADFRRL